MANPYLSAPLQAFWRHGVAASKGEDFSHLFTPKFSIDQNDVIATAGSCFAQHISRALIAAGCRMLDAEPAPRQLPPDTAKAFGYGLYSGRYGNIYTARQMRDLYRAPDARAVGRDFLHARAASAVLAAWCGLGGCAAPQA